MFGRNRWRDLARQLIIDIGVSDNNPACRQHECPLMKTIIRKVANYALTGPDFPTAKQKDSANGGKLLVPEQRGDRQRVILTSDMRHSPVQHPELSNMARTTSLIVYLGLIAVSYGWEHEPTHSHHFHVRTDIITKKEEQPYPVEVIKHVPYPVKVHVENPVPYHVPKPYPVEVTKEVRVPVHIHVPQPYPVVKEVKVPVKIPVDNPVPYHVTKPYPVVVEKKVPYPVHKEVPVPVKEYFEVPKPYHVPVTVEKKVPYIVEKKIPVKIEYPVEKPYPVEVPKPYPVTVEKKVPYVVEKKVPYPVKVPEYVKVPVPIFTHGSEHQFSSFGSDHI
ncbi:unnamed protein product [Nezara viridula]|uniref:Uncharacterized protein n=1 Tax=Nezara viridula TaxID=85310 RepID=A0A9P0HDE5_NEZVI|nr:unnamed protein product [Nezara viridula]